MLTATLLSLGSAGIHAGWNLLLKTSNDRVLAAWGLFGAGGLLALGGLAVVGLPGWSALPFLVATGLVHIAYSEALVQAYGRGDLSLAYPLARGGGALLAAVGGVLILDDRLSAPGWIAIGVVAAGLLSLRPPGRSLTSERTAVAWAGLTALCIASYTLIDSAGSRQVDSGVAYGLAAVLAAGVGITLGNVARPARRARVRDLGRDWPRHLVGGLATTVAYTMVLVAVRSAPVGYVTMLRESSVVIGALLGWLVLNEALGPRRMVSSAVILAGLVALVAVS